jgi:hypothetical protein
MEEAELTPSPDCSLFMSGRRIARQYNSLESLESGDGAHVRFDQPPGQQQLIVQTGLVCQHRSNAAQPAVPTQPAP